MTIRAIDIVMVAPPFETPEQLTRDERSNAMLAHVLTIFAGFFAAGIIYLAKRRESRFVSFHALQALLWHLLLFAGMMLGFASFVVFMVATAARAPSAPATQGDAPPLLFIFGFFGVWLVLMLCWASNVGFCIYLAIRANEGRWTRYPLVGSLALRLLGAPASADPRP